MAAKPDTIKREKQNRLSTAMQKNAMLKALEKSLGIVSPACESVGIARDTYYEWLKNDEVFKDKVMALKEIKKDFVESKLMSLIRNNDNAAIIFANKTLCKDRGYVEKTEIAMTDETTVDFTKA